MVKIFKNEAGVVFSTTVLALALFAGTIGVGIKSEAGKNIVAKGKFFENYPEAKAFVDKNKAYTKVCYIDGTYPGPYRATPKWQVNSQPCP